MIILLHFFFDENYFYFFMFRDVPECSVFQVLSTARVTRGREALKPSIWYNIYFGQIFSRRNFPACQLLCVSLGEKMKYKNLQVLADLIESVQFHLWKFESIIM